jgi:tRNA-2-methylthio-N6-dimethylallyladenosine synthase
MTDISNSEKTFFIRTFGCQMNKHDSEEICALLEKNDYVEASTPEEASVVLLNTCSVRGKSENRVYGWLGQLKSINPRPIIGVCGCMPQYAGQDIFHKAPHVDLVFGVNSIDQLPKLLARINQGEKHLLALRDCRTESAVQHTAHKRKSDHQAWVSIMYGCDNYCSYCIVPYTRGRERSRQKEQIFTEIGAIDLNYYKEITLLGQNVNSYGKNLYTDYTFADLLHEASQIEGVNKISFMTSHPKDMSDQLIKEIADNSKISLELHLPAQSGDNEVLKRMNRGYSRKDYIELIKRIRRHIPNVILSTDLIVGFPGETEAQFQNTLELVKEIGFARVNTAAYSPRPKTAAARFPDQVPEHIRSDRLQRLLALLDNNS